MEIELKPCPFCGEPGEVAQNTSGDYARQWFWWALCSVCPCELTGFQSESEAVDAWNNRAKEAK
jgi:Lar family restriction alleviation protein